MHETSCENAHAVHLRHAMEVESVKGKRDVNGEETLTERSVTSSPPFKGRLAPVRRRKGEGKSEE